MKLLKKISATLLAGTLIFSAPQVAIADAGSTSQNAEFVANEATEEMENLIDDLDTDIEISEDGILCEEEAIRGAINGMNIEAINDFYVMNGMSPVTEDDLVRMFEEGIESINEEVQSGEMEVLENGTIVDADDDAYYLQGGSTYDITYWWGKRRYKSTAAANAWVYKINKGVAVNAGMSVIAGAVFGGWGAVPNGLTAAHGSYFASRVAYVNSTTNRGIIADVTWVLTISVRKQ